MRALRARELGVSATLTGRLAAGALRAQAKQTPQAGLNRAPEGSALTDQPKADQLTQLSTHNHRS